MRLVPTACFLLTLTVSTPAAAQLTVVAEYRMGENDTGVAIGGPANAQTLPGSAGVPLQRFGSPVYAGESAPNGLFSSISIRFDGSTARYQGPVIAIPTNNCDVEAWVRAKSTVGNAQVVYNGKSGNSGFGVFRAGANWSFLTAASRSRATAR